MCIDCRLDHDKKTRDQIEPIEKSRKTRAWAEKYPERFKEIRKKAESKKRVAMREMVLKFKASPCSDCQVAYPYYVMHCDHRPGEVKMFDISRAPTVELLALELAKCDVVCGNCHASRTHSRKQRTA